MQAHAAAVPRAHRLEVAGKSLQLLYEFAGAAQTQVPSAALRISASDLESAFGGADVQIAVVAGRELRYVYANESYRRIRPDFGMLGRTYREVFPEAAEAGAEARLRSVIDASQAWIVDDYPTPLPNRDLPAWWQGECAPIEIAGTGRPDAALIILWEVTHRHVHGFRPPPKSEARLRIEAAKAKLRAQMTSLGLDEDTGWRISEQVHENDAATIWTLRPIHLHLPSPAGLFEQVEFDRMGKTTHDAP
jgi:hypothetical protein